MVAGPTPNMGHDPAPRRKPGPQQATAPRTPARGRRRAELVRPPFWMTAAVMVMVVASWVPLALFARARVMRSSDPRVQIMQDMGSQPKYLTQTASDLFADGRELRPKIADTVARGQLQDDDQYYRGFTRTTNSAGQFDVKFYDTFPQQITLTTALLNRGQERFNIYCSVCHGIDGHGNGQINVRAQLRGEAKWVPPAVLHSEIVKSRPVGHLFNTATNGIRNMAGYAAQISTEDRWAIVAYLRALQTSEAVPARELSAEQLDSLR